MPAFAKGGVFSKDLDVLARAPKLFDAYQPVAYRLSNAVTVNLTSDNVLGRWAGSFLSEEVEAGMIAVITGTFAGSYGIVVALSTSLTIAPLHAEFWPDGAIGSSVPIGSATGIAVSVYSFKPLARQFADMVCPWLGIDPADADDCARLLDYVPLRCASSAFVLAQVFRGRADAVGEQPDRTAFDHLMQRYRSVADSYEREWKSALRRTRVQVRDANDANRVEWVQFNATKLVRG